MKEDRFYQLLIDKMHEVSIVPPQTFGPLTHLYKKLAARLKFSPWQSAFVVSVISVFFLYLLLGAALVRLASLLQYGF